MSPMVTIFENPVAAAQACGARIFGLLDDARRARGLAHLAVSGGSTPRLMFEWMARQAFEWRGVHIYQVDERCVPPDHELSNFRMMKAALLDGVAMPEGQIHRIEGELAPEEAAARYRDEIRLAPGLMARGMPVFDVIHRGMGGDAHTASLFPGEALLADRAGIAAAVWVGKLGQHRVTLLPAVLEATRNSVALACGGDKADALWDVLHGARDVMRFPAQIAAGQTEWYLDRDSAARLPAA